MTKTDKILGLTLVALTVVVSVFLFLMVLSGRKYSTTTNVIVNGNTTTTEIIKIRR